MKNINEACLNTAAMQQTEYQSIDSLKLSEPRLEAITNSMRAILEVVQLEVNGQPITPSGFRLRNPKDWTGIKE